jgi:hypothetical protein
MTLKPRTYFVDTCEYTQDLIDVVDVKSTKVVYFRELGTHWNTSLDN